MWNKNQIRELKEAAYHSPDEDEIREHLTALNVHLNNFERQPLVHKKKEIWKEVEREADYIKARLASLNVEWQPQN